MKRRLREFKALRLSRLDLSAVFDLEQPVKHIRKD
jgi:hypothetical protein